MNRLALPFTFLMGACATAAVQSAAAPQPVSEPSSEPTAEPTSPDSLRSPQVSVLDLNDAEQRRSPPGTATVTLLAGGDNAFLARLDMQPGASVPVHRDVSEEYIHILSGRGTMTIDGKAYEVSSGTTIFMPAHAEVSFVNGDEPLSALQVFAGPESAAKYESWPVFEN